MKSKFFGINAKMALAALAVCGLFTSCYEKEEIDVPNVGPTYVLTGNIISATTGATIGNAAVTVTPANFDITAAGGSFESKKEIKYGDKDEIGGKSYTVSVTADGYINSSRVVYLPKVANGQVATVNVDFYLFDAESQIVDTPEEGSGKVTDEATAAKAEGAIKTAVADAFKGISIPGATAGDIEVTTLSDGSTKVVVPVALNSKAGEPVEITYYALEGFAYTILDAATKALTPTELWLPSAEKYLNRKAGLRSVAKTITISAPAGYSVEGYKLTYVMANEALIFNSINGIASYQKNLTIYPVWYSHDTHDSHDAHDGHGINPGAGGGSSANN